jgi:hypothetical protein
MLIVLKSHHTRVILAVAIAFLIFMHFSKRPGATTQVSYPEGYRSWQHIKSGIIGSNSPIFKSEGGIHHIYANDSAMIGYKSGKFPESSILVFDKLELIEDKEGNMVEGKRIRVDVMVKDNDADSTGGWRFERFMGNSKSDRKVLSLPVTKCFNCHRSRKNNDFVFSKTRE